jgi:anthranilate/para-aminobenzoate synthase component I
VITVPAEPLPAAAAARRIAAGRLPAWLCAPAADEVTVAREYLACDPVRVVRGEALDELEAAWAEARAAWQGGPEIPVGIGYLSYDLGRQFERLGGTPPPPSGWPGIEFRFYDAFYVREAGGGARLQATDAAAARALAARLAQPPPAGDAGGFQLSAFADVEPPERHLHAVERVRRYLHAGDAYQVNLARRLRARLRAPGPPGLELFARLASVAPAPHALWLGDAAGGRALVGNSPERFLRLEPGGLVSTAPIKGTRPRGEGDAAGDAEAARALRADPKDRAEHVMIVDLERNDLGRVCEPGSVAVVDPQRLMTLPSVFHLVTTVRGRLRAGVGLGALLRACFPGGSITGAPKIRAMQIIDELEPACRGPYTGATGWLGAAGDLDLAIAIRTALLEGEALTLWVGGGVVVDSSPEAELAETRAKARAFTRLAES